MLFTLSRAYAPLMPSAVVLSSSLPSFSNFSLINFILRLYRCNFKILICYNAFMKTFINRNMPQYSFKLGKRQTTAKTSPSNCACKIV